MTPKAKELRSADELEESSCTRKKKSRRVSFAETTIHVFKRDEESASPADSHPGSDDGGGGEESVGFRGDISPGDGITGSAPREDEEEDGVRLRFPRDVDSSSPGSTAGSEGSNKDDNFFGPVSRSFINAGRLSLSGMSDDNNDDVTLDSTAFSLHFRNIVPPDDRSANSVGSIRTPTVESSSSLPSLIQGAKPEDIANILSAGQISNISGDGGTLSQIRRDPNRYDYAKLSPTLQELMNQVNVDVNTTTSNSDFKAITSRNSADEVGHIRQPSQNVSDVGKRDSSFDDSDCNIQFSPLPVECPKNDKPSPNANAKSPPNHLNNDKFQGSVTCSAANDVVEPIEATLPEVVIDDSEKSPVQTPVDRESDNNLDFQSSIDQKLLTVKEGQDQCHTDSAPYLVSNVSPTSDAVHQMKSVCLVHTPTIATKFSHDSPLKKLMSSLQGQKQQQLLIDIVPSSSKSMDFTARGPGSPMESPNNAIKMIQFPPLQGSISTLQAKRRQLLDYSLLSRSILMNTPAREQSASLKKEIIKHSEIISAIKSHLTASRFKSSLHTDDGLASLRKQRLVIDLKDSLDEVNDDPCMSAISAVNVDTNGDNSAKESKSMENFRVPGHSGDASDLATSSQNTANSSIGKNQSERKIGQDNNYCNNLSELHHIRDSQVSEKGQITVDSKELSRERDEASGSSNFSAGQSLQPATSILVPYAANVESLENSDEPISCENAVHNEKTGLAASESFHVGGLSTEANLNDNSLNIPMNMNVGEMVGPSYDTGFGGTSQAKETLPKILEVTEFSAEDVQIPNRKASSNDILHSFSKTNMLSPKQSQALQPQQEASCSEKNEGRSDSMEGRSFLTPELVTSKVSDATNHLLPPSISNLNLRKHFGRFTGSASYCRKVWGIPCFLENS
ncbi:hypothetical protein AXF42_Ash008956 [Apostasia shenzhenica]|uniref:Uncharacterized protein n=1 Tax=Apostasia shenzhenica TaxID=1088818 RepID=A0A2I0AT02_9ASPA|nr:hypothetical protein AXF42_Ash008956 [Apostasia shenzhenica]